MMKVCINCHTENPVDEVCCSECGMSLVKAPTGEEAVKAREEMERARSVALAAQPAQGQRMRRIARILALIWAGLWTLYVCFTSELLWIGFPDFFFTLNEKMRLLGLGYMVGEGSIILIPWVSAAIAWRWQAAGGFLLFLAGPLLSIGRPGVHLLDDGAGALSECIKSPVCSSDMTMCLGCTAPVALLGLVPGFLCLLGWRRSRALGSASNREPPRDERA